MYQHSQLYYSHYIPIDLFSFQKTTLTLSTLYQLHSIWPPYQFLYQFEDLLIVTRVEQFSLYLGIGFGSFLKEFGILLKKGRDFYIKLSYLFNRSYSHMEPKLLNS